MSHRLKDAVVVITGASSGIGRATAMRFAKRGARLMLAARNGTALEAVADQCRAAGTDVQTLAVDTADKDAVNLLAERTAERFGRIDVWVNNASVAVWGKFDEIPTDDFRRVIDVNLMGYVYGARAVLPLFKAQKHGVLINVGSLVSRVSTPYNGPYVIAKHGVRAIGEVLRQELALEGLHGVDVVTVMPATIDTPFFQNSGNYTGWKPKAMPPVYTPERVARAIVRRARRPRREVFVGNSARVIVQQHKVAPGTTERVMASMTDHQHLDRKREEPPHTGILFEPPDGDEPVRGGWHGGRKTAVRRLATAAVVGGALAATSRRDR